MSPFTLRRRGYLRRLSEEASPGPWKCSGEVHGSPAVIAGDWREARPVLGSDGRAVVWALWVENDHALYFGFWDEADRVFIQEARAAVPALLDALDAAEVRIKTLETDLQVARKEQATS